jgi:hypothetical protein
MAFTTHFQTPYVFGFDAVFAKNGYRLPAAAENQAA